MEIDEKVIKGIVEKVVEQFSTSEGSAQGTKHFPGVFDTMEEAVYQASKAFKKFVEVSLETRRSMIAAMRQAVEENVQQLAAQAVEETGMGRAADKIQKNLLAARSTPGVEDVQPDVYSDDHGLTLIERAPYGVIGAIAPSTNPTETIINNSISMLSAGNVVVFNGHPAAKNVSVYTVGLLNEAIIKAGGPQNVITTVSSPTIESGKLMMEHPLINLLTVTGGPGVVNQAMKTSEKVIAAGPGNPPSVVDETADIPKAARDLVNGAGFDNNIVCICEKEIVAVRSIADALKSEMVKAGAFELTGEYIKKVTDLVIADPGRKGYEGAPNKKYVGKNASFIAAEIGLSLPEETKILLLEVDQSHPLLWTEQLMPVIPLVRVDTVDQAIDLALDLEHGFRHSASMHSLNIAKLSKMAKLINCSLFVKNGSNFNGMGFGGSGFTSFTIASPTGEGFTRARTFTRERRCSLIDYFRIV